MKKGFFERIGSTMPSSYVKTSERLLKYIRAKISPTAYVGIVFFFSILIATTASLLLFALEYSLVFIILGFIISFLLLHVVSFSFLILIADDRAKQLEANFPDVLSLISANLRAGMTVDKAILSAAKPEFGPLEDELKDVGKDIVGGVPINEALLRMADRVKSEKIKQTMRLITEGIKSGGELESLLREIADDMRSLDMLKEEVRANLAMYTIFIFFAACIAAPIIYGISSKLVEISIKLQKPIIPEITTIPVYFALQTGTISITEADLFFFYTIIITIITVFASFIYGLIVGNRLRGCLKYTFLFFVVGSIVFYITKFFLNQLFVI